VSTLLRVNVIKFSFERAKVHPSYIKRSYLGHDAKLINLAFPVRTKLYQPRNPIGTLKSTAVARFVLDGPGRGLNRRLIRCGTGSGRVTRGQNQ
jgi:hypothetical protein